MAVTELAPALDGPALSTQEWGDLTFLHWPVDPHKIAPFMPSGVRPDVIDGVSYVGLVPFTMRRAGPGRLRVRYFGDFYETNVRLYSVDDQGRNGIVFRTLEANRLATVLLARTVLGLPYTWARMSLNSQDSRHSYRSTRRWPRVAGNKPFANLKVTVGDPVEPTPLETWLTSRWGLHTRVLGRTLWVPNEHPPWSLRTAELTSLDEDLVARCGVEVAGPMLRPLFAESVTTRFGRPVVVR